MVGLKYSQVFTQYQPFTGSEGVDSDDWQPHVVRHLVLIWLALINMHRGSARLKN